MTDYLTTDTELTSVANAIRTKGGTSAQLTYPTGFVSAIDAIPTGGGGTQKTLTITLTTPYNPSYAATPACTIYEGEDLDDQSSWVQIGQIETPTGNTTVTTAKPVVITEFHSTGELSGQTIRNESGCIELIQNGARVFDYGNAVYVYKDGGFVVPEVDYDD